MTGLNVPLNIDWHQILLHLFNFTILAGGLYLLLYKPVKDFMDKRTAYYQGLEDAANEKLSHASALEADYQSRMDSAEDEITRMKAKAMKSATGTIRLDLAPVSYPHLTLPTTSRV